MILKILIENIQDFTSVSGKGVKGKIDGVIYYAGNINYIKGNNINIGDITKQSDKLLKEGKTVIYFANEKEVIGIIAVADTIKEESYLAIKELKKQNIDVV